MTRSRSRLLIALALFAVAATAAVTTASASQRVSDETASAGATVTATPLRPGVGSFAGEPDMPAGSPNVQKPTSKTGVIGIGFREDVFMWVLRVWAMWLSHILR